jgi:hypothetical protein
MKQDHRIRIGKSASFAMVAVALLICSVATAAAQLPQITAQLTRQRTPVGVPVQMRVQVNGSTNASMPEQIRVDGLRIKLTGRSTQVQVMNFKMTTSGVYTYTVLPEREGTFRIPSFEITVDNKRLAVPEQQLVVDNSAAGPPPATAYPAPPAQPRPRQRTGQDEQAKVAYAELIVPKKVAYVGELVPVEVRFYFDARYRFEYPTRPMFSGEGFTVADLSEPERDEQEIGGVPYRVISFQSAVTPLKAGDLEIPFASLDCVVHVPGGAPAGMDDLFSQFFGQMGGFGFTDAREAQVKSGSAKLQVKALPREGKPENFTGAIGEFNLTADATPRKAEAGDPITFNVVVTGRGNFDAMGEPTLTQTEGWKLYPPGVKFDPADRIGYGGTKTFENMIVAREAKTETPGAEFSYFDPVKEQYFTIKTDPIPVEADAAAGGQVAAAAPTATGPAEPAPAEPAASGDGGVKRSDIAQIFTLREFRSITHQPVFWAVNGAAGMALLAFLAVQFVRWRRTGERKREAALRREGRRLLAGMDAPSLDDGLFYEQARRFLEIEAEQATGSSGAGVDDLLEALRVDAELADEVRGLAARADEFRFSGGLATRVDTMERRRVIDVLKRLEAAGAK